MKQCLKVESVNDYARYVGAEVLHPLVSVIHYDELEQCRHSLNSYQVYGIILMQESPYTLTYGQGEYRPTSGSLLCVAPGQMGGMSDNGEIIHIRGWMLLFAPELLYGTELGKRIDDYHFFSYYESEALHTTPDETRTIEVCLKMIRHELQTRPDGEHLRRIITAYLELILEYCSCFYERQFKTETTTDNDLLKRFDALLHTYYAENRQQRRGLPTVHYCAQQLFLSPNYFGDLIHQATGDTATMFIRNHVMQQAIRLLCAGKSITEAADLLGFEYPQHFTRMFKKHFGESPRQYVNRKR
ncbi:MAG: AraC family transcriptional regulator [Bacteroidaceae bacterium]|nr:AraC family transcriptional regulator [Bacteroidaceae bacterium]